MRTKAAACFSLATLPLAASEPDLFTRIDTPQHTVFCSCHACGSGGADAHFEVETGPGSSFPTALSVAPSSGAFDIILNPNATLAGNAPALAAFERAAATWEAFISDPITVNLSVGLEDLDPGVLASAGSVLLSAGYDTLTNAMVLDAGAELDDGIVSSLPTFAQSSFSLPTGFLRSNGLTANKATLKALGFTGLDTQFGANDATINFSTNFAFDYDNSDGVGSNLIDFETVALHEIGHSLGFTSATDTVDFLAGGPGVVPPTEQDPAIIAPRLLDLFRFADGSEPGTEAAFTTATRTLEPDVEAVFTDLDMEGGMSTGAFTGDGRQASHWKDNNITGALVGIMDPTLANQQVVGLSALDLRALDVIGFDIAFVPEPSTLWLTLYGFLMWRRRR
ncbi:NF038122 family metalloprotease [Haloferula rosea]|uniref:NF038122 family metalloprotease n=1 Tax=Haloferula rosea TaxID=490093 RepID=A0A934RE32_9BACT|nr:NF038122 family metalloprotease [Haloferula rosea]MBK1826725.1 NF038122 family metalloprotease [Haloferula rosea]